MQPQFIDPVEPGGKKFKIRIRAGYASWDCKLTMEQLDRLLDLADKMEKEDK